MTFRAAICASILLLSAAIVLAGSSIHHEDPDLLQAGETQEVLLKKFGAAQHAPGQSLLDNPRAFKALAALNLYRAGVNPFPAPVECWIRQNNAKTDWVMFALWLDDDEARTTLPALLVIAKDGTVLGKLENAKSDDVSQGGKNFMRGAFINIRTKDAPARESKIPLITISGKIEDIAGVYFARGGRVGYIDAKPSEPK
ncbi:MAG: hypothetical protein U0570_00495 [Phycisphaerales bacterium]